MSDSVILTALRRSRLAVSEEIARLARELAGLDAAIASLEPKGVIQSNEAAVRVDPSNPAYQAPEAPTPPEDPNQPEEPLGYRLQREAADFEAAERAKREEARVFQQGSVPAPQLVQAAPPVEQQGSEDTPPWVQQAQQPAAPAGEKKRRSNDDIAAEHGVALSDVKAWKDANGGGRVVKADIEQYAKLAKEHAASQQAVQQAVQPLPQEQTPPPQQGVVPAPQDVRSQPIAADQPLQPHDEKAFRANPQQFAPTPAPQAQQPQFQPVQQVQQPEAPQFAPQQPAQAQQPQFQPPQMQLPPGFAPTGFSPS